jgi:hypothetical protein
LYLVSLDGDDFLHYLQSRVLKERQTIQRYLATETLQIAVELRLSPSISASSAPFSRP